MKQMDFVEGDTGPRRKKTGGRTKGRTSNNRSGSTTGPREGCRRLTADIPADLHKRLKMQALIEERTVTDIIIEASRAYLSHK